MGWAGPGWDATTDEGENPLRYIGRRKTEGSTPKTLLLGGATQSPNRTNFHHEGYKTSGA